tara:strand:- start:2475 stop:3287 length:813 start_codon:yes stop_codon:yes gene_type:complete
MQHALKFVPVLLALPVLSACTYGPQQQEFGHSGTSYAHHNGSYQTQGVNRQGNLICSDAGCAPSATYSVSNKPSYNYGHAYHQPSYDAYGSHADENYSAAEYSHSPKLRGAYGHKARHGYKYGTLGVVNYDEGTDNYGIQARLGYQSSGLLGAEVEGSIGISDDEDTVGGTTIKSGAEYSVGAFARAKLPLTKGFSIHARGGYHLTGVNAEAETAGITTEVSDDLDGFAYGAGAEYAFSPRSAIRLDYTRYESDNNVDMDAISLGYTRKF